MWVEAGAEILYLSLVELNGRFQPVSSRGLLKTRRGVAFITGFGLLVVSEGDLSPEGFRLFPSGKGMHR